MHLQLTFSCLVNPCVPLTDKLNYLQLFSYLKKKTSLTRKPESPKFHFPPFKCQNINDYKPKDWHHHQASGLPELPKNTTWEPRWPRSTMKTGHLREVDRGTSPQSSQEKEGEARCGPHSYLKHGEAHRFTHSTEGRFSSGTCNGPRRKK